MDFLLLNVIYRVVFVSSLALIVDIELQKARFVCFLFLFVGELVLYLQSLLLRVSFQWSSWVASLQKFCFEFVHVLLNFVLEEFVLSILRASPLTNPLLTLVGWHEVRALESFSGLEVSTHIKHCFSIEPFAFVYFRIQEGCFCFWYCSRKSISRISVFNLLSKRYFTGLMTVCEKEIYGSLRNPKRNLVVNILYRHFSIKLSSSHKIEIIHPKSFSLQY